MTAAGAAAFRPEPVRAVVVVIPARDEVERLPRALDAVNRARSMVRHLEVTVVVVAHRCTDGTARLARDHPATSAVLVDDVSVTVAGARHGGVQHGLAQVHARTDATWILSTDADSEVPTGWITELTSHPVAAVVGRVELRSPELLGEQALRAYGLLVAAGVHPEHHDHVYGANLAVRADAYASVGGFPAVTPGEDVALVGALRTAGWPLTRPLAPVVATSSRMVGRAEGGLADLLHDLSTARAG